mgnify:CR=1 FL=1
MRREQTLEEISDGKLYDSNDMVKADCHDCEGCCDCCQGMGDSVILDPYDVHRLSVGLKKPVEQLLQECLELGVSDGNILPHLRMTGEKEQCVFLNKEGRCSIHAVRPGFCRLFPLGRYYENGGFSYFLQTGECAKENRSKIKVSKWIDTPDLTRNQQFTLQWHDLLHAMEERLTGEDEGKQREENLLLLRLFYLLPYEGTIDFYTQFTERMEHWNGQNGQI